MQPTPQQPPMTGHQYLATRVANSDAAVAALMDENTTLRAENEKLKAEVEKLKAPADPPKK